VGERSYLSIGDVLALLREEFPDITISKIRFLESRGLLVPERTPSGYRKFYDHDVDRLRWILRQQREHFLPLKVIKGRLEGAEATAQPSSLFDTAEAPPAELTRDRRHGLASVSASGTAAAPPRNGTHPSTGSPPERREPAVSGARIATMQRHTEAGDEPVEWAGHGEHGPPFGDEHGAAPDAGQGDELGEAAGVPEPEPAPSPPAPVATALAAPPAHVPETATAPPAAGAPKAGAAHPRVSSPSVVEAVLSGATLSVSELAQASGLRVDQVEELESFGLIEGRSVAGVHCFDEEALVLASLAAAFARYGVEARHLRIFKHAAERQSGLYGQVVMPLLRQRNPSARARAQEDLQKLAELGTSLQACFSRAILRDLTGG
jgi:DNA-binding transcriptional MerR regulator